jgi:hypothetical protein
VDPNGASETTTVAQTRRGAGGDPSREPEDLKLSLRGSVENQAQRRRRNTAETAMGRIRVNGVRPVRTNGGRAVGRIGGNRIRSVVMDSRISAN